MSKTKQVLKYLLLITIIIVSFRIVLFSLKFILASEFPLVVVEGRSMEPTFYDGDLLAIKGMANKHDIKLTDIIVFYEPTDRDRLIVHRVVQINSNTLEFRTKGDNNPTLDPWIVRNADIVGVVVARVPTIGPIFIIIQSPIVTGLLIILLIIEYIGYSRDEKIEKMNS